jgi:hypothetical protein
MMAAIDPRKDPRKVRARVAAYITIGAAGVSSALPGAGFGASRRVPEVLALIVVIILAATAMASSGDRPGGLGRGIGLGWRGRDDDAPAWLAGQRWPEMLAVSRLMPRAAAHPWLAEAESEQAEIAAARRGAAIRSYVRSAPRLTAMMRHTTSCDEGGLARGTRGGVL